MNSLIVGSISDVAAKNDKSLAESFLSAEMLILADTSASMATTDVGGFKNRYQALCHHLTTIQGENKGKVALVSFSGQGEIMYCPNGSPRNFNGSTDLAGALLFVKVADECGLKIVVISDGEPDSKADALYVAKNFSSPIDVIYCGKEGGAGQKFLFKLASMTGGKFASNHADVGQELQLLLGG